MLFCHKYGSNLARYSNSTDPKPYKSIKLKKIAHHLTAIDYNSNTQKILVGTLNEKVQLHSIDPEVSKYDIVKIRDAPSGHFLLDGSSKCGVFDVKYSEKDGSKFFAVDNNGFVHCDIETQT